MGAALQLVSWIKTFEEDACSPQKNCGVFLQAQPLRFSVLPRSPAPAPHVVEKEAGWRERRMFPWNLQTWCCVCRHADREAVGWSLGLSDSQWAHVLSGDKNALFVG